MLPHQERVVVEKVELDDRLSRLRTFLHSDAFCGVAENEKTRLYKQEHIMTLYSAILADRIAAFK